jgi:hypothetical protein
MADDPDIQIDRMTSTISSMVSRLTDGIAREVADIKTAYQQLAAALGAKGAGAPKIGTAVATAEAPVAAPSGSVGVQLVKVINGSSEPVPVSVLRDEQRAVGGAITAGAGAVGAFVGNLFGGFLGGASLPIVVGELIVLVAEILAATPVIKQILALAAPVVAAVDRAISNVKALVEEIPAILDVGIRVVLTYLEPVINFAGAFIKAGATLIGGFLAGLVGLVNDLFAKLPPYLSGLLSYLIDTALRPAITPLFKDLARALVDTLASALLGAALAFGKVLFAVAEFLVHAFVESTIYIARMLIDTGRYIGEAMLYSITLALSMIPSLGVTASATPKPPDFSKLPEVKLPDLGKELKDGFQAGAGLGKSLAESMFGPTPEKAGQTEKPEDKAGGASGRIPPTLDLAVPPKPVFEPPVFTAPRDSVLPDLLQRTTPPGDAKRGTSAAEPAAPVNFNGGITIHLSVARIDGDNAPPAARALAENLLLELKRMSEVERFRRGLPTGGVG